LDKITTGTDSVTRKSSRAWQFAGIRNHPLTGETGEVTGRWCRGIPIRKKSLFVISSG